MSESSLAILTWMALVAVPMSAGIAVLAAPLVAVLFGARWAPAADVLVAIAVMQVFAVVIFPLGDAFRAAGRQREYVVLQLLGTLVLIPVLVIASSGGIVVLAWAQTAEVAVFAIATIIVAQRVLGIRVRSTLQAAVPGMLAGAGVVAGAGIVRVAWPEPSAGPLVVGTAAGMLGAVAALRIVAPGRWREIVAVALALAGRSRASQGAEPA